MTTPLPETPAPDDMTDPAALPPEFDPTLNANVGPYAGPVDAPGEPAPLPVSANPDPAPASTPGLADTLKEPPLYAKAIMAGVLAGTGAAGVAALGGFTAAEVWAIVATTVAAFVGVFGVRNAG